MKKGTFLVLLFATLLWGCQDAEEIGPGQRPDERLSEALADYKSQLVNAPYGWKAILYPEGGAAYSFLFRFQENDRVSMLSDINKETATEVFESTYRLKALQRPTLLFDTYSYIHILSDPDESKSGGDRGQGRYSDFEFAFDSTSTDAIFLEGNHKGSKMVLVKATQEEAAQYIPSIAKNAEAFEKTNTFSTYFKRLSIGNRDFDVNANTNLRFITFSWYEGNSRRTFSTDYYFTEEGLVLMEPLVTGEISINQLNNLQYSKANQRLNLTVNNTEASIREASRPIKIDLAAAQNFHNSPPNEVYWLSFYGFTVEGARDAYQIRSIPNFALLVYWPRYGSQENTSYDLMGFVSDNTIQYGLTAVPSLSQDGRIIYTFLENLGEIPAEHAPMVTATMEQWTDPEGFYVIPTGPNSYDLVSAKDAKAWIRFQ